jgi:hypothetical protein
MNDSSLLHAMATLLLDKEPLVPTVSSEGPRGTRGHEKRKICPCWKLNPDFSVIESIAYSLY